MWIYRDWAETVNYLHKACVTNIEFPHARRERLSCVISECIKNYILNHLEKQWFDLTNQYYMPK